MTFLQPFILWGIPLLFIPIIIHLLNRLRHRPQPWGAMRFLQAANRSSISHAKLRQLLVLLFRVLAVVALVFFLSRPMAGGWLGWALSPAPEVVVLVLDRSASMEAQVGNSGKSRREQALELWTDALGAYQSSRLVLVDSATQTAQEIPGLTALSQKAFVGPTQTRADLPTLIQRAYSYLSDSKSGAAEVWIASDLQESNWAPADARWERVMAQFASLRQKVRFRLLSFPDEGARNAAIDLVEALRTSRGEQRNLSVVLDVQTEQAISDPVVLRWQLGGNSSQTELKLDGDVLRWRNSFPLPNANEPGWGVTSLSADANPADNDVFFAYDVERAPGALIVSGGAENVFPLQLAGADLARGGTEIARVANANEFITASLTNTALIVWAAPALPDAAGSVLTSFVQEGGSLLFLPSAEVGQSFAGLAYGGATAAATNNPFAVAKWNDLEGPFARTEEGYGVPLGGLEIYRRASISGEGAVLASFTDGAPFLVRKALGKGEVYFCATSAESDWSSLAEGPVLVPMFQRLIAAGASRFNSGVMIECGDAGTLAAGDWTRVDSDAPGNAQFQAGIYKAEDRFVAVNRPSAENNPVTLSADRARALFRDVPFQLHEERGGRGDRLHGEIWRVFVTLMLIFLIAEGILILPSKAPRSEESATAPVREAAEVAA